MRWRMSKIIGNSACPECKKQGRDRTDNHLMLFEDGGAFCNRCGYTENKGTFTKAIANIKGDKTEEEIKKELDWVKDNSVVMSVKERNLKQFACEFYDYRTGLSFEDGKTPIMSYSNIYQYNEATGVYKLIGYKCKSLDKKIWIKGKGKEAAFFGADKIPTRGFKLFITEGQEDAIALYQSLYENIEGKFRNRIAVVSLQNGAGSASEEMIRNQHILRNYKEIVLCFDMDAAGREAVSNAVAVLPKDKVKVAQYELKDANDMVKAGLSKELYFNVIQADKPRPEKILDGGDMSLDSLLTPLRPGLSSPYPGLDAKYRGFRTGPGGGELTVLCAGTGFGKTTLARELDYHFNKVHQQRIGHIFLEEHHKKTGQSLIAIDNDVPLSEFRADPSILPREAVDKSYQELINNGRTFFMKHWGSLASEELMDHMWYFSKVCKCDFIFLDHISLVVSGQHSQEGERRDLDILMTKLAAFTEESGTSVIAIVHLKRPDSGSFNEGKHISLKDLRGSAAIEQLSHNVIAIEGDQQGSNPNLRTLRALKNREWGDLGECQDALYEVETGRLRAHEHVDGGFRHV